MKKTDFIFEEIEPFKFNKTKLREAVSFLITNENKQQGDITVIFCSDDFLLKINEQYLNHSYYTDIVTFDYVENSVISGDLFISVDRIADNAKTYKVPFDEELSRVVLHGVLHLTGYKDDTDESKTLMRKKEDFYLIQSGLKAEDK